MDILIPELGEGIDGGDVVEILVSVGDAVAAGQAIVELETGKATVEIPAPGDGTITAITISPGDNVAVGTNIGSMEGGSNGSAPEPTAAKTTEPEAAPAPASPPPAAAPAASSGPVDIVVPALGEDIDGGDVVTINVAVGDEVSEGDALLELETGKATVDLPAPASGKITALNVKEGDHVDIGQRIGAMEGSSASAAPTSTPPAPAAPVPPSAPTPQVEFDESKSAIHMKPEPPPPAPPNLPRVERPEHAPVPAAPSVRKFAREIGIDIATVPGTGPKGRISHDDVKGFAKSLNEGRAPSAGGAVAGGSLPAIKLPDFASFGEIEVEKMSTIRKMTLNHMAACWATIPHVTQHDDADTTDLEAARQAFKKRAEAKGARLSMTAMLVKILGGALKAFPNFNASIDPAKQEIIYKKYVNIGIAVDTPKGLVVPVIRDVDQKNMIEIAAELGEIAGKAREGKITPAMLSGGCISLSNLGGLHGKYFTPIVNAPEVAILGVGRASMKPHWDGSQFIPRLMTPLSLSYDHRLIDGADGTRFLRWIVEAIENPVLLSLEG